MIGVHGFTAEQASLPFIAVAIGTTLGVLLNMVLQRKYFQLVKVRRCTEPSEALLRVLTHFVTAQIWRGFAPAEERLSGTFIGAPLLIISLFWYGWTGAFSSIHWIVSGLLDLLFLQRADDAMAHVGPNDSITVLRNVSHAHLREVSWFVS
jgi:MFS transporter, DHA1 family, multidrug resistance protein